MIASADRDDGLAAGAMQTLGKCVSEMRHGRILCVVLGRVADVRRVSVRIGIGRTYKKWAIQDSNL